ncbi:MAG: type II toxin-antitoxin system Phd/YefM family antitoxin, partial [Candidatus Thiodiazotropha sp.]
MDAIAYSITRAKLASTMNQVCEDHAPVIITRKGAGSVV